jgi:hypothetical protein
VRFCELEAAKKASKAASSHAMVGASPSKVIEARDAAPAAQEAAQQAKAAPKKEVAEGIVRRLQQSASGLAHAAWEPRRASHNTAAAAAAAVSEPDGKAEVPQPNGHSPLEDASGPATLPGHRRDVGHLSVRPIAEEAAAAQQPPHVRVQLTVQESNLESLAMFSSVAVQLLVAGAGSTGRPRSKPDTGQEATTATAAESTSAGHMHMPKFGGLLRAPAWALARAQHAAGAPTHPAQGQTDAAAAGTSSPADAAPVTKADAEQSGSTAGSPAGAAAAPGPVSVSIQVREARGVAAEGSAGLSGEEEHCSVTLSVREEAASSGLGRLAGLFRSSRGHAAAPQRPKEAPNPEGVADVQAGPAQQTADASQPEAGRAGTAADEATEEPASSSLSAGQQQQQQVWGLGGAVGSLYGYVSHAAEATLRSAQQATGSSEPSTPVSGGDHFSSMRAAMAGSSGAAFGSDTTAAAAAPQEDVRLDAAAAELVLRLKTCAASLLEVRRACLATVMLLSTGEAGGTGVWGADPVKTCLRSIPGQSEDSGTIHAGWRGPGRGGAGRGQA